MLLRNLKITRSPLQQAALCFLLQAVLSGAVAVAQGPPATQGGGPPGQQGGGPRQSGPASPVVQPDGRVTFNLKAPNAAVVTVDGNFQLAGEVGLAKVPPMVKGENGVWTLTIGPLKQDFYQYAFLVDGNRVLDPSNAKVERSAGAGRTSNWFLVPGSIASDYAINDTPHGTVSQVWYNSPALKSRRRLNVYTPPGYEDGSTRYPVMYLIHGGGQDEFDWITGGRAPEIWDNLIAQGKAVPAILVMPSWSAAYAPSENAAAPVNGGPGGPGGPGGGAGGPAGPGGGPGGPGGGGPGGPGAGPGGGPGAGGPGAGGPGGPRQAGFGSYGDSIVSDLIPFVDTHYRTLTDRDHRGIGGISVGGAFAMTAALQHLDQFSWVVLLSPGLTNVPGVRITVPPPQDAASRRGPDLGLSIDPAKFEAAFPMLGPELNKRLHLLYLSVGGSEGLRETEYAVKQVFDDKGVKYEFATLPGYGHEYSFWRQNIVAVVPELFRFAK